MVETITPDVCGSRRRQAGALLFFGLGALAASACLGALLGVIGSLVGAWALPVAAVLALVGAAREGGFARVPLPQSRRQVPEPWRFRLPLPAWAAGYGAGLGLGFLTYQPVATFWVACAAAVALGRPLAGAVCFAAYGAGRSLLLLLPLRRGSDATAIVEALAGRRRGVLRVNAVALLVCAELLPAPASDGELGRVVEWMADRTEPTGDTSATTVNELFADYEMWCLGERLRATALDAFASEFDRVREVPQLAGKIRKFGNRYYGIRLVTSNVMRLAARNK